MVIIMVIIMVCTMVNLTYSILNYYVYNIPRVDIYYITILLYVTTIYIYILNYYMCIYIISQEWGYIQSRQPGRAPACSSLPSAPGAV